MEKKPVPKKGKAGGKAAKTASQPKHGREGVHSDWKKLEQDLMICSGSYSQAHKRFKPQNQQGAATCIVACAFVSLRKPNTWTQQLLDDILEVGTNLHLKSKQMSDNRCLAHMTPTHIYKYFFLDNVKISMRLGVDLVNGRFARDSTLPQKLEQLLNNFFEKNISGVFAFRTTYFAIWKSHNYFFIFDPAEHNTKGGKWTGRPGLGHCYCIRSTEIAQIGDIIMNNCPLKQINKFTIYPCDLEKFVVIDTTPPATLEEASRPDEPKPTKVVKKTLLRKVPSKTKVKDEPPVHEPSQLAPKKSVSKSMIPPERPKLKSITNFGELTQGVSGILRASTHQSDPKFTRYAGQQSTSNALAALTMLRQYKAKVWNRKVVDDILRLGEIIHHDYKNLPPLEDPKKITLNEADYAPIIHNTANSILGRYESNDIRILGLEQALRNMLIDADCCILRFVGGSFAFWKEDNKYYMFNPNECDVVGKPVTPGQTGVACVIWFTSVASLAEFYMKNLIPRSAHQDPFTLTKVTIEDYVPKAEDWYNYKALTATKWILRGSICQKDRRFGPESQNAQCTANATMALTYKELKEEKDWDLETVDQILIDGDELYRGCVDYLKESGKFKHKYLMVDEVKRTFDLENKRVNLEIEDCLVNGIVNAKSETGIPNLLKGFEEFFADNEAGIVTANLQSMAVWRKDNIYYYCDSHSRNEKGAACGFGTACVLRLVTLQELTEALVTNLGADSENLYNISRVVVKLMELAEDGTIKPPPSFYETVNEIVAILRSNFSEKDKKFEIRAGKQTVPMCLAALVYNSVTSSYEWNKDTLDTILTFGDKLYSESMELNYKDDLLEDVNNDEISTINVKKEMMIGPNKIQMEFEEFSAGNLEDNLTEALETLGERDEQEGNSAFQAILESQYLTVALWGNEGLLYLFDPKPRDANGQVYGKDDWSAKIVEEVEEVEEEEMEIDEEEGEEDGEFGQNEIKDDWQDESDDIDEMGGGDNLGEPEPDPAPIVEEPPTDEGEEDIEDEQEAEEQPAVEKKGSAYWREQEKEGKACVLRFGRLDKLIEHILENSPPNRRQDIDFSLKLVKIENTPILHEIYDPSSGDKTDELLGDWNEFKEFDYGKWILRGVRNLKDLLFPEVNRGKQAFAMCLIALAFASLYALSKFNADVVGNILAYGDRLYTLTCRLKAQLLKDNTKLSEEQVNGLVENYTFRMEEYPKNICMGEKLAHWEAQHDVINGHMESSLSGQYNLFDGLTAFFEGHTFGIVTCGDYSVAVWKSEDMFYMFDSHATGPSGIVSPGGVACITRFKNLEDVVDTFKKNQEEIGPHYFAIHAYTFTKQSCVRERHPAEKEEKAPQVGGFAFITAGKEVLRGDIKLDCTKFDRGVNLHSAAIAFVALALSLNRDSDTWTRMIIDEILTLGEELYNDSLDKLGDKFDPWSDRLDICRVNTDFMIGCLKVNCAIRFSEQRGIVDIKNSKTPNLRQGLERFFEENTHGVVVVDKLILPVWEHVKEDKVNIYMFDPNSRGPTGLPGQGGVACVLKFCNAKVASDHIKACLMDVDKSKTEFAIIPVEIVIGTTRTKRKVCEGVADTADAGPSKEIEALKKPPPIKPAACPDKETLLETKRAMRKIAEEERALKEAKRCVGLGRKEMYDINNEESIIRGLRSVEKDKELPVNIVAFIFMKVATNLNKWTYKQIELILEAGYQLYIDSFVAYSPKSPKLTLQHLLRRIIIKDSEIRIDVKKPIVGKSFRRENLLANLNCLFNLTNFCILSYNEQLVSIYFKGGYYYMFDPYSRDLNGNKTENGSAVLMRFSDLSWLVEKLLKNLQDDDDEQQPKRYAIIITKIQSVQPLSK